MGIDGGGKHLFGRAFFFRFSREPHPNGLGTGCIPIVAPHVPHASTVRAPFQFFRAKHGAPSQQRAVEQS